MIIKSKIKDYLVEFESNFNFVNELTTMKNSLIVIDKNFYTLYKDDLFSKISLDDLFILDAVEAKKNMDTVLEICDKLTKIAAKRNAVLISFGGGITQDIVGFAANVMYRGISWIFVPTTLLASADSCIGGKTSLNYKSFKNILGTFYPPTKIIICSPFFKTLPDADYRSGLGEVIKFNVMSGEKEFYDIEDNITELLNHNYAVLDRFIKKSLEYKKAFIEEDEFDKGVRILLNFAHTFGHAIETVSNYEVPHGSAVAIGMLLANNISCERGILNSDFANRINNVCRKVLTLKLNKEWFQTNKIVDAMKKDKKQVDSNISVVLLADGANVIVVKDIKTEEIERSISLFLKSFEIL